MDTARFDDRWFKIRVDGEVLTVSTPYFDLDEAIRKASVLHKKYTAELTEVVECTHFEEHPDGWGSRPVFDTVVHRIERKA